MLIDNSFERYFGYFAAPQGTPDFDAPVLPAGERGGAGGAGLGPDAEEVVSSTSTASAAKDPWRGGYNIFVWGEVKQLYPLPRLPRIRPIREARSPGSYRASRACSTNLSNERRVPSK